MQWYLDCALTTVRLRSQVSFSWSNYNEIILWRLSYTCNINQNVFVEHDFFKKIIEFATSDNDVMEWPCYSCPLCWAHFLAHPNGLTWHFIQHHGQGLDHSIVHRNPRCKPCSQLVARRKCTFGESIQRRPYISNFNRAPIMILTSAPAAVAVAAMGMLVFSITGKSKSKSNMGANVTMSHMELLTHSKIRDILVQLQTVAS